MDEVSTPADDLARLGREARDEVTARLEVGEDDLRVPILWHSNAPWVGSGYGMQSALFVPLIERLGNYRCAFSAFYGLKGSRLGWVAPDGQSFIVYPGTDSDGHGNDVMGAHAKHWFGGDSDRGIVIALTDPWVLWPQIVARLPMLAWIPIDHDPLIPRTHNWLLQGHALPVAMSEWGQKVMQEAGHETVYYVPHGYDPDIFFPRDQAKARREMGLPSSAFIVGMVAANLGSPSRKCFGQAIKAFSIFQQKHPEALLYLHTKLESSSGEDIPAICRSLNVRSLSSDQYGLAMGTPSSIVGKLMSSFDVLINPSLGEGFGVPMLESQACGTPVITNDFSASPEVAPTAAGNWAVEGQPIWTPFESWQQVPSVDALVDSLEQAYADSQEEKAARRASVAKWAADNYQAEYVAETYWRPVLEQAQVEFNWRRQLMVKQ